MRAVSVFGATGSVGENTFDLLMRQGGPQAYRTVALTGGRNVARLVETVLARVSSDFGPGNAVPGLEDVLAMDHLARVRADEIMRDWQRQGHL